MHNIVKVENESRLYRDLSTGAIINTDSGAREAYLKQRENLLRTKQLAEQNTQDIKDLRGEINDIKHMLTQILANVQK